MRNNKERFDRRRRLFEPQPRRRSSIRLDSVRRYPNLQKKRIYIPELKKTMILTISTRALKTIQKNGAYQTLKKAGLI